MQTTFLKKKSEMLSKDLDKCHEGVGAIHWTSVLDSKDPGGNHVQFFHDDILPPNTYIGVHQHTIDQEYY